MQAQAGTAPREFLFSALASFAGAPALLVDEQLGFEYANARARELLDCPDSASLESKWVEIARRFGTPPDAGDRARPILLTANITMAGGPRLFGLELHRIEAAAGGGYFALLKDRKVLDHFERELLLASECRGWVHQSALLVHDLKGILNSMQISLELLADPEPDRAMSPEENKRERRIRSLKDDLTRMNQALRNLPGAESGGDPPIDEFDARDVIRENLATLRLLVRKNNVEVSMDLPDMPLSIRGRRAWIKRAIFNAAAHRINSMRAGGKLSVYAAPSEEGVVVRLGNEAPDRLDGYLAEGDRSWFPGRDGAPATDLLVARAICESEGGSMEVRSNGSAQGMVIEMHLRH